VSATLHIHVESGPDGQGRHRFTAYWLGNGGVFRPEASKEDGKPVGYRRGQCFHAHLFNYPDSVIHGTDRGARGAAWGVENLAPLFGGGS